MKLGKTKVILILIFDLLWCIIKLPFEKKIKRVDNSEHYTEADYQTWMRL